MTNKIHWKSKYRVETDQWINWIVVRISDAEVLGRFKRSRDAVAFADGLDLLDEEAEASADN